MGQHICKSAIGLFDFPPNIFISSPSVSHDLPVFLRLVRANMIKLCFINSKTWKTWKNLHAVPFEVVFLLIGMQRIPRLVRNGISRGCNKTLQHVITSLNYFNRRLPTKTTKTFRLRCGDEKSRCEVTMRRAAPLSIPVSQDVRKQKRTAGETNAPSSWSGSAHARAVNRRTQARLR